MNVSGCIPIDLKIAQIGITKLNLLINLKKKTHVFLIKRFCTRMMWFFGYIEISVFCKM